VTAALSEEAIGRLAFAAHTIRPDWPTTSVVSWLLDNPLPGRTEQDVTVALLWLAADPRTKTPARLAYDGPWWRAVARGHAAEPRARVDRSRLCSTCSLPEEECRRRWPDDHAYVTAEEHQAAVADTDPLIRALQVRDLKRLVATFGRIPKP